MISLLTQIRRNLAILYKRFLCHKLGFAHAAQLAARQAVALSALKRLTNRGAPPPPATEQTGAMQESMDALRFEPADAWRLKSIEECISVTWRKAGLRTPRWAELPAV
jgi:hypothetical protein